MIHREIIQYERYRGGVVLHVAVPVAYLLERPSPITTTPPTMMGCLLIPLFLKEPLAGGVGVEEVEVARAVVTPMGVTPLEEDGRKRMDFPAKSKYLNSVVRRVIPMMWLMPLGSGLAVLPTTVTTMRIHTSCLWWSHLSREMPLMCLTGLVASPWEMPRTCLSSFRC